MVMINGIERPTTGFNRRTYSLPKATENKPTGSSFAASNLVKPEFKTTESLESLKDSVAPELNFNPSKFKALKEANAKLRMKLQREHNVQFMIAENITPKQAEGMLKHLEQNPAILQELKALGADKVMLGHGKGSEDKGNHSYTGGINTQRVVRDQKGKSIGKTSATLEEIAGHLAKNNGRPVALLSCEDGNEVSSNFTQVKLINPEGKSEEVTLKSAKEYKGAFKLGLIDKATEKVEVKPESTHDLNHSPLTVATHGIEQTDFLALFEGTTHTVVGGHTQITGGKINLEKLYQALNEKIIPAGTLEVFLTELEGKIGSTPFSELKTLGIIEEPVSGSYTIGKNPRFYPTLAEAFQSIPALMADGSANPDYTEFNAAFNVSSGKVKVIDAKLAKDFILKNGVDDTLKFKETLKYVFNSLSEEGNKAFIEEFVKNVNDMDVFLSDLTLSTDSRLTKGDKVFLRNAHAHYVASLYEGADHSAKIGTLQAELASERTKREEQDAKIAALENNQPKPIESAVDLAGFKGKVEEGKHGVKADNVDFIDANKHVDPKKLLDTAKGIPDETKRDEFLKLVETEIGSTAWSALEGKVYDKQNGKIVLRNEVPKDPTTTGLTQEEKDLLTKTGEFIEGQKGFWGFVKGSAPFVALLSLAGAVWAFISGNQSKDDNKKQLQGFVQQLGQTLQVTLGGLGTQVDSLNQQLVKTRKQLGNIVDFQNKAIAASMNYSDEGVQSLNYNESQTMNQEPTATGDPATTDEANATTPETPQPPSQPDELDKAEENAKKLAEKAKNRPTGNGFGASNLQSPSQPPTSSSGGNTTQQPNTMQPLAPGQSPLAPQQGLTSAAPGVVAGYGNVPSGMVTIDAATIQALIAKASDNNKAVSQVVPLANGIPTQQNIRLG